MYWGAKKKWKEEERTNLMCKSYEIKKVIKDQKVEIKNQKVEIKKNH